MAIVFDEITAQIEPEAPPPAGRDAQSPPPPPERQREAVRAELSLLAARAARLMAD